MLPVCPFTFLNELNFMFFFEEGVLLVLLLTLLLLLVFVFAIILFSFSSSLSIVNSSVLFRYFFFKLLELPERKISFSFWSLLSFDGFRSFVELLIEVLLIEVLLIEVLLLFSFSALSFAIERFCN